MAQTQRKPRLSRGQRNCDWIEQHCHIPEGRDIGKAVILRKWQVKEIKRIYDNPRGTRRAIISFGRKNGKTALAAFLLLLHLCGPEAKANSQLYSAAQSREQAGILFALAAKIVRMSPSLCDFIGIRDTAKQLYCTELGTLYRALSSEAPTAYGLSPVFIVHDELGQVKGPRSELYDALETATAAQEAPLSIVISTQAATDADLLSILIDDAKQENDPRVILSLYTADMSAPPFAKATIKQANPAFGDFQNAEEVMAMAADAMRMPSREAEYRNLILNQRVEASNPFVSRSVWEACGQPVKPFKGPVYMGLDLSETSDLTAAVMISENDSVWDVKPFFWLPEVGLPERARQDRVPYDLWHTQGYLEATPGKSVEYEWVANRLKSFFDEYDIRQIAFDRWNWRHFKPWLEKAGFSEKQMEKFIVFGQGSESMSPALRTFESALLNGKIRHGMHPVLTMCAANAIVDSKDSSNRKLSKKRAKGRIDGMVALTMAFGVAASDIREPDRKLQMFLVG